MEPVRLQKFLARAGVASRRASEELIASGRVSVNGEVVREMGTKIDPACAVVELDGARVTLPEEHAVLMLNKPAGYLSAMSDAHDGRCVSELVPTNRFAGLFALETLRSGVVLEDGPTQPAEVELLERQPKHTLLEITIYEGRNRQIRRMGEAVGHPVRKLERIALGPLSLSDLEAGTWRLLSEEEHRALLAASGLSRDRMK